MDSSLLSNITYLETTPAGVPPPGVTPNFANPPSNAYVAYVSLGVLLALALMALATRLWIRLIVLRTAGWDDFFAFLAGIIFLISTVFGFILTRHLLGRHTWDIPLIAFFDRSVQSVQVAGLLLNPFTSLFIKLAILILVLRIFPYRNRKSTAICCYVGIAVVTLFNIANLIVTWYACMPRKGWRSKVPVCTTQMPGVTNVFNAIIDVYIFFFPLPAVLALRLTWRRRMGIIIIFATGFATCACSIMTCVYRFKYANATDWAWYAQPQLIGANAEQATCLIVNAIPCFPAVARHIQAVRRTSGKEGFLSDARYLITGRGSPARQSKASSLRSGPPSDHAIKQVRQVTVESVPRSDDHVEEYEFDRVAPYNTSIP